MQVAGTRGSSAEDSGEVVGAERAVEEVLTSAAAAAAAAAAVIIMKIRRKDRALMLARTCNKRYNQYTMINPVPDLPPALISLFAVQKQNEVTASCP